LVLTPLGVGPPDVTADFCNGLFASFWSLAGRFWSTPISGHISRLSWVENEPHAGRVLALEESLVCVVHEIRRAKQFH